MSEYITINIPYKSYVANVLKSYIANNYDIDSYSCNLLPLDENDNNYYSLGHGIHTINFKGCDIIIDYNEYYEPVGTNHSAEKLEKLIIKIKKDSNSHNIINDLFNTAREFYVKKEDNEIICRILRNGSWILLSKLPKRSMDTIYLDKNKKDELINDITNFLNNKDEYIKLGIPWKRNYLLYGHPGTGKSSLIFSIASQFNMSIYIINLGPSVDDSVFMSSISNIPKNTILLLEDIDALFIDRKHNDSNKSMVSFSGILNVLDGIARKCGLITFMTTNYIDRLDSALKRANRVDMIIKFDKATKDQVRQMFNNFFEGRNDFDRFYNNIKHYDFTLSQLQKFFMRIRFGKYETDKELYNTSIFTEIINETKDVEKDISSMYM